MPSRIIVSGGDAPYFPLILDLIKSVRQHDEAARIPIAIIDGGLTAGQKTTLEECGVSVAAPCIPDYASKKALRKRGNLSISLSKLWLNKIFSAYEHMVWIDADAWVQDFAAVQLLFDASATGHLAIIPQAGRFWEQQVDLRWLLPGVPQVRSYLYKNSTHAGLPWKIRKNVANRAALNGGIYAMLRDAPHWRHLQDWQQRILKKNGGVRGIFTSDQMALSLVTYEDKLPVNFLSQWCNYMGPWRVDAASKKLVEYYFPHKTIGIVHLAGQADMRRDAAYKTTVPDITGSVQNTSLRFGRVLTVS